MHRRTGKDDLTRIVTDWEMSVIRVRDGHSGVDREQQETDRIVHTGTVRASSNSAIRLQQLLVRGLS